MTQSHPEGGAPLTEPGLRERKAAATRQALAEALAERLRERPFADITVDELAAAVGVSRVTFFNYFPTKEQALDHIFASWHFTTQCEAAARGLVGAELVLHFFDSMGAWVAEAPERARRVLAWFAVRPRDRPPPELSLADRARLAPELPDVEPRLVRDLFREALSHARAAGALAAPGTDLELGHMLGALLFGGALVGHSASELDWRAMYVHHARATLGLPLVVAKGRERRAGKASPRGKGTRQGLGAPSGKEKRR
jgi:AcrR family transcriptional regulator